MRVRREGGATWLLFILPALLVYAAFMVYPVLNSLRLSFFSGKGYSLNDYVGFDNYLRLFAESGTSERFFKAFGNTWVFFAVHMLVQNSLGLIFALILSGKGFKGKSLFRTIIFVPVTLSVLVTGYVWKLILNPQWGALNLALERLGLESLALPWLGDPRTALVAVSLVSSWQWVGLPTMMFLAGLERIPEELFEAAQIDGAGGWLTFLKV
ncbi:MAG: sugar ABC transporter permease, partial [Spirochaetaceae bacterium]|nr:sugar ABC transporter permease [Spirochaetaceae bacterium]